MPFTDKKMEVVSILKVTAQACPTSKITEGWEDSRRQPAQGQPLAYNLSPPHKHEAGEWARTPPHHKFNGQSIYKKITNLDLHTASRNSNGRHPALFNLPTCVRQEQNSPCNQ